MITVQSLWIGDSLSELEALCIRSFIFHGHPFHLYTYGNVDNIPQGTVVRDASEIIPEDQIYRVRDSLAIFSDQFRWELLSRQGGCWVDMDMICLRPFEFENEIVFGLQGEGQVATGVRPCSVSTISVARDQSVERPRNSCGNPGSGMAVPM